MKKILGSLVLMVGAAFHLACSGSGAVSPLSPSKASTPEASTAPDSQVSYWSPFPLAAPVTEVLNDVVLLSKKHGWACGNNGMVLEFDGDTWNKVETGLAKNENLMALAFASEDEGWVAGTHGTILHYNNGTWGSENSTTQELLYNLAVTPGKTVWVVGSNGTLLYYNGVSWGKIAGLPGATAGTTLTEDLYDIGFSGQNNGWAVGNRGTILRYDGQKWDNFGASPTSERLNSVSVINNNQAWIVGAYGTILRFSGTTWNKMGTAFAGFDLYRVRMRSDDDGWAVGQDGTLIYYDGSRWISHVKPEGKPALNGLDFYKDTGFVVGQNGTILRYEPNGETTGLSFTLKGRSQAEPAQGKGHWSVTYELFNQSPKASPLVSFVLPIPKGLEAYTPPPTPTATGAVPAPVTPTPVAAPAGPNQPPSAPGAATGSKGLPAMKPLPLGGNWKMRDDRLEWEIGNMASSDLRSITVLLREKKDEKKELPCVLKAEIRSNDRTAAQAAPLTLLAAPEAVPSPHAGSTPGN